MNRRSLGALAVVILILMGIVATAGLDNLPRSIRSEIQAAASRLDKDWAQLAENRQFITRAVRDEPALFRAKTAEFQSKLERSDACAAQAAAELATLQQLAGANQRSDVDKARAALAAFNAKAGCIADAQSARADAQRWIEYKRQLPSRLQAMNANYEALKAFDAASATGAVAKAMSDWPAKKDDLQQRLDRLEATKRDGISAYENSVALRETAQSGMNLDSFDYAGFFGAADRVERSLNEAKQGANTLNELAGQLYTAWDKVLVDVDKRHNPPALVRTVTTKFQDASLGNGQSTSDERWENVSGRIKDLEQTEGMVFERKAAGKYDFESEKVVEPPAYARIAPPGQSNQYGSWQNGVWHWLPQYLILSQLLNMNRGPIGYNDYHAYDQARRRGETFYGRNNEYRSRARTTVRPGGGWLDRARDWSRSRDSGGNTGGWYRERPKTWGSSGGYSGSQYRNRGSYSGSRYQSRPSGGGFGGSGSRGYSRGFGGGCSFGRGGRR